MPYTLIRGTTVSTHTLDENSVNGHAGGDDAKQYGAQRIVQMNRHRSRLFRLSRTRTFLERDEKYSTSFDEPKTLRSRHRVDIVWLMVHPTGVSLQC